MGAAATYFLPGVFVIIEGRVARAEALGKLIILLAAISEINGRGPPHAKTVCARRDAAAQRFSQRMGCRLRAGQCEGRSRVAFAAASDLLVAAGMTLVDFET